MQAVDSVVDLLVNQCPDNFVYADANVEYYGAATKAHAPDTTACNIAEAPRVQVLENKENLG